ncbi:NAD(P)-binding protein [Nemania serpens]|nr:NAD(P)-binding protein [Nemania serpens]
MAGTIVFTGANSSLGIHAVEYLLQKYGSYTAVLTVRDASDSDVNTNTLRDTLRRHPNHANASVHELDLSDLSATHAFADEIAGGIKTGKYPPVVALVCNAYHWNLIADSEITPDGFDKTLEVNHISHAALVLRLLGSFGDSGGRIIEISSDSHWPGKNPMEKYPPSIPADLNQLTKPAADPDKEGRGYQRYANSKLMLTTWIHALNDYLQTDRNLSTIAAIAMDPGNMVDSRALRRNTPSSFHTMQKFVYVPLLPLLRFVNPTLRTAAPAAVDVIELALNPTYAGQRGYFIKLNKDESSPESNDKAKQKVVWNSTLEWARIGKNDTALQSAFD